MRLIWPGETPRRGDGLRIEGEYGKELRIVFVGDHLPGYPIWNLASIGTNGFEKIQRVQDEARRAEIEWFSGAVRAALEEGWPQLPADPPPPPPTKLEKLHRKAKELGYRIIDAVDDRDDDRDED